MSGKTDKRIRKAVKKQTQNISDTLIKELLDAPFKFRFLFAMRVIFRRKNG